MLPRHVVEWKRLLRDAGLPRRALPRRLLLAKQLLTEKRIAFEEIDIERQPEARAAFVSSWERTTRGPAT